MRRPGAGRKNITEQDPSILRALDQLIEPETIGGPGSPLRWVCRSTRSLPVELGRLDRRRYPTGRKAWSEEMKKVDMELCRFHGEWNHVIEPRKVESK